MNAPVALNVPSGISSPPESSDYDRADLLRLYSVAEEISDFAHNLGCDYKFDDTELTSLLAGVQQQLKRVALNLEGELRAQELLGDTWREMSAKRISVEREPKTIVMSPEEIAEVLSW